MLDLRKCERFILCQFRTGVLPLHIETGRYTGLPADQTVLPLYSYRTWHWGWNAILLKCDLYNDLRQLKFSDLFREIPQGTDNEELTM